MSRGKLETVAQVAEQLHRGGFTVEHAWALVERALLERPHLAEDLEGLRLYAWELEREARAQAAATPERADGCTGFGCALVVLSVAGSLALLYLTIRMILDLWR